MITFQIAPDGDPQKFKTIWSAQATGTGEPPFLVGRTVNFKDQDGAHRGIDQGGLTKKIPQLYYDRHTAAKDLGLWAHFIWPTVMAEGGGHHLTINTYDRARFTFGFYQLAAHTPSDNLILLFRALLQLPKAADYFPDLFLNNGKVFRRDGTDTYSLEEVTKVHRPNNKVEDQLVAFMSYLNPDTANAGTEEVLNAAKLMHWLVHDPAAVKASTEVAFSIMSRKIKKAISAFGLTGKDPRLAIWISDIRHQGRGKDSVIQAALAEPTLDAQLEALYQVGSASPDYDGRRTTVRDNIAVLDTEGVFGNVKVGDPKLSLP